MEVIAALMNKIDSWIWGLPMLVLLCGTHIFMTFRTGFIQRKTLTGIRLSVTKHPDSPGDVSQFQALATALASTIGTGNIIGVGTAIYLGTGCRAVVLADRRVRHCHKVRGEPDRGQVPRADRGRPHDGRCDVRA